MSNRRNQAALIGGGALALFFLSKKSSAEAPSASDELEEEEEVEEIEDEEEEESFEDILLRIDTHDGTARLGRLYHIKPGDTPLAVMREALFGSRDPVADPVRRKAVIDLLERAECSPWNQASYARAPEALMPGHAELVKRRYVQRGVSFNPIYSNNRARMMLGEQPTSSPGKYFAYIWIPMIDVDLFDQTGEVTLEGMNWPDNERGRGHSMIDPPFEIIDLGFEEITNSSVGCEFPEGDFRRFVVAT